MEFIDVLIIGFNFVVCVFAAYVLGATRHISRDRAKGEE